MEHQGPDKDKLFEHIEKYHPRKRKDGKEPSKFGLCDNLGTLDIFPCKTKKSEDKDVTELAKQIGLGPTLFLMSTAGLVKLFMILFVLNLPLM